MRQWGDRLKSRISNEKMGFGKESAKDTCDSCAVIIRSDDLW